jgi:hypothetical protein
MMKLKVFLGPALFSICDCVTSDQTPYRVYLASLLQCNLFLLPCSPDDCDNVQHIYSS